MGHHGEVIDEQRQPIRSRSEMILLVARAPMAPTPG
jgi:hypothetical protein